MSKTIYTLGQEGARKFKELTSGKTSVSKRIAYSPQHGIDNYYPTPYQVQWAQSSGKKDANGKYLGTYIIWLPKACLKVNHLIKENWGILSAANYTNSESKYGWFDLSKMLDTDDSPYTEFPDKFDIWLDYSKETISFHFINSLVTEISRRILIAQVKDKNVIQNVNSSITISDTNKPFDIIEWNHDSSTERRLVRNWFYSDDIFHTLSDETLPVSENKTLNAFLVSDNIVKESTNELSSSYRIEFTEGNSKPSPSNTTNEQNFLFWKQLYTFSGTDGSILYDYRDAVVEFNWFGIDNKSISYGEDGQCKRFLHLNNFYNTSADVGDIADTDKVLIRRGSDNNARLAYAPIDLFGPGTSDDSDISSKISSYISVDNCSISKGGDGQLSGVLHMNDFHNSNSDTTTLANSSIVLRTPYSNDDLRDVANKLEYMPYEQFKNWLDVVIANAINEALDDALSETGDITNAIEDALSGSIGMFAWDEETRTIGPGGCMVGRQWYTAQNTGSGKADGLYSVVVTLNSSGTIFCGVVSSIPLGQAPTDTQCWIPIYQITDGKIAADYRGAFVVPAYD